MFMDLALTAIRCYLHPYNVTYTLKHKKNTLFTICVMYPHGLGNTNFFFFVSHTISTYHFAFDKKLKLCERVKQGINALNIKINIKQWKDFIFPVSVSLFALYIHTRVVRLRLMKKGFVYYLSSHIHIY